MWFHKGTAGHKAVEYSILSGDRDIDSLLTLAETYVDEMLEQDEELGIPTRFSSKENTREEVDAGLERCLNNWLEQVPPGAENRLAEFEELAWPPQVEVTLTDKVSLDFGVSLLHTQADAIFKDMAGKWVPVDWKTGASKQWADPIQLEIYAHGIREAGLEPAPYGYFYHMHSGEIQTVDLPARPEYIASLIRSTDRIKRHIDLAFLPRPGWYCKPLCPWQDQCPAFTLVDTDALEQDLVSRYRMAAREHGPVQRG